MDRNCVEKFFFGSVVNKPANSAVKQQIENLKKIWHSENYQDFGIERIFRLFATLLQFIFPGFWVRHLAGKCGFLIRKIGVEIYLFFKIFLYIKLLMKNDIDFFWVAICCFLIFETIMYLFGLIFMNTEYSTPASYKRNTLLMIFNFIEISLAFACIYKYFKEGFVIGNEIGIKNVCDAVYFSFVNATSVGFGDIVPITMVTKVFATIQGLLSFLFSMILLGFFVSNINAGGFLHKRRPIKEEITALFDYLRFKSECNIKNNEELINVVFDANNPILEIEFEQNEHIRFLLRSLNAFSIKLVNKKLRNNPEPIITMCSYCRHCLESSMKKARNQKI